MTPRSRLFTAPYVTTVLTLAFSLAACSTSSRSRVEAASADAGPGEVVRPDEDDTPIDPDEFWENDPPPQWCGKGKAPAEATPGGTPECPDDKNKEGCPCPKVGEEAPCWPGLRKHRGLGICRDGVTRCEAKGELDRAWGACRGAVKPKPAAMKGADACSCFSKGTWAIDNVVPCIVEMSPGKFAAVSTMDKQCPTNIVAGQPLQKPAGTWSKSDLTADCAGHFELCYAIKAGDLNDPKPSDCVVARVCTKGDYTTPGKPQAFPALPHWVSNDATCVGRFETVGGYSEMTVTGESVRCDDVSDDGAPLVFRRGGYCPFTCADNPSLPECQTCATDASGEF